MLSSLAGPSLDGYEKRASLSIAQPLLDFVEREALPETGVETAAFWEGLAVLIGRLAPRNKELLGKRDTLQSEIDTWYAARTGRPADVAAQIAYLREIGYLTPSAVLQMTARMSISTFRLSILKGGLGCQIADLAQVRDLRGDVGRPAGAGGIPRIDFRLQRVAFPEQFLVSRCKAPDEHRQTLPESGRLDTGFRQSFAFDKVQQWLRDAEAGAVFRIPSSDGPARLLSIYCRSDWRRVHENVRAARSYRQEATSSCKPQFAVPRGAVHSVAATNASEVMRDLDVDRG